MRVKILSGNQTGDIQDLPQIEAEVAIQTGYAEAVVEPPEETPPVATPKVALAPVPVVSNPRPVSP